MAILERKSKGVNALDDEGAPARATDLSVYHVTSISEAAMFWGYDRSSIRAKVMSGAIDYAVCGERTLVISVRDLLQVYGWPEMIEETSVGRLKASIWAHTL